MPYPRYGGRGQDEENYRREQGFHGNPNPWQGPEMNSGLTNVNPMALVGNLVGAMVGQMAAGGGGGLGALMAMQAGQQQGQGGWPHGNADRGVRQDQERDRERRRRRSRERSSSVRSSNYRSRSRERRSSVRGRERRGRSPVRAEHEIYVGNYPVKFREADVRKLFEESGVAVGAIRMKMDGLKVFAFAETESTEEVEKAKRMMEGKEIEGRKLRVRSSKDPDKKNGNESKRERGEDKRVQQKQKLVITREDTTKHLVQAFHDFLGRQLEGNLDDVEFRGEIESARTALAFAYSLPKDDSLKVSRKIEDTFYRDAREELSKASKGEGSAVSGGKDANGNWRSRSRSDEVASVRESEKVATETSNKEVAIETSSIKKEKNLNVKDEGWQRDEIGALEIYEINEKASEEVEEVDNDDLDNALAEADLGFTLEA